MQSMLSGEVFRWFTSVILIKVEALSVSFVLKIWQIIKNELILSEIIDELIDYTIA